MSYYEARLSINKREKKPDPYRGTPYTLTNVGTLEPKGDGTFSAKFQPGTYWIELGHYNSPSESGVYLWPKVIGLPKTITIKSGETTWLDYRIDAER